MRALFLSLVIGIAALGMTAAPTPAQAQEWRGGFNSGFTPAAWRWGGGGHYRAWRGGSHYYYPRSYYYGGSHYYYPGYYSSYPSYSYYSPGYASYYAYPGRGYSYGVAPYYGGYGGYNSYYYSPGGPVWP